MLSIIITYHEEGQSFIQEFIDQIRATIDVSPYEIIVVDDCSKVPLAPIPGIKIIRHDKQRGVGVGFDTGVAAAQYDNLVIAACDIRVSQKTWASQILNELEKYPKSLTCFSCVNLNREKPENMDIEKRKKISVVNGSRILIFHDHKTNPRMTLTFRGIIECQWLPSLKNRDVPSFEIPCILGGIYAVKKEWYQYIDGFYGHRNWGTLEPLIGLKSWLFGGSCRTAPRIEFGHIFKKSGTHGTTQDTLMYNKMLTATFLFPDYGRLIAFLGSNPIVERARKMYQANLPVILKKREEYQKKTVFSIEQFVKKWNVDYRH